MRRVLFVFVDGVGVGASEGRANPFTAACLPALEALAGHGAPVRAAVPRTAKRATLLGLDASMGVEGLPQSGTGHVALLTGENAARLFGRHFGPWTPTSLRPLLAERSLLIRAARAGRRVAFANAYPEDAAELLEAGRRRPRGVPGLRAGPTLAAHAAGLLTRHAHALAAGDAVASEIVNDGWRDRLGRRDIPAIPAGRAGRNLGRIAADHDLTFFAHYTTDHIGHRGSYEDAVAALERIDRFIGGVLQALPPDAVLIIASDHGNIEDMRVGHTHNPALGLVAGPNHRRLAGGLRSLTDVAPVVLGALGV